MGGRLKRISNDCELDNLENVKPHNAYDSPTAFQLYTMQISTLSQSLCLPGRPSQATCFCFDFWSRSLTLSCLLSSWVELIAAHAPENNDTSVAYYPAFLGHYLRRWLRASHCWTVWIHNCCNPSSCAFPSVFMFLIILRLFVHRFPGPVV